MKLPYDLIFMNVFLFWKNALEEEVRNRDNVDISLLEQQFDRETDSLIVHITERIHEIRDEIKSHRPTNIHVSSRGN